MVFVLVVAGTALIGWGGLAAWQAVTQNNGSTASTLGVHMSNTATVSPSGTGVTCNDQGTTGPCGAIFAAAGITPGYSKAVGTVTITNTGTEASTFQLALKSDVVTQDNGNWTSADITLCGDLQLTVKDGEASGVVVYNGSLAAMPTKDLVDNGGNPTWSPNATDTFTFSLALPAPGVATDEDSTCTAAFTWGQNGA
jgi:hypothetical protein